METFDLEAEDLLPRLFLAVAKATGPEMRRFRELAPSPPGGELLCRMCTWVRRERGRRPCDCGLAGSSALAGPSALADLSQTV